MLPWDPALVSMCFSIDGQPVWHVASRVGRLYAAYLAAVEHELNVSAGAAAVEGDPDDVQIASEAFVAFVIRLRQLYSESNHGIFRSQLSPVLFPAVVMLHRAGHGAAVFKDDPDQRNQIAACDASMPSI
jgi:hypothetical protein